MNRFNILYIITSILVWFHRHSYDIVFTVTFFSGFIAKMFLFLCTGGFDKERCCNDDNGDHLLGLSLAPISEC